MLKSQVGMEISQVLVHKFITYKFPKWERNSINELPISRAKMEFLEYWSPTLHTLWHLRQLEPTPWNLQKGPQKYPPPHLKGAGSQWPGLEGWCETEPDFPGW